MKYDWWDYQARRIGRDAKWLEERAKQTGEEFCGGNWSDYTAVQKRRWAMNVVLMCEDILAEQHK